ncbi:diaminopimelate decarboxylase [Vagococcus vulneris]|uniref:Diaminopimelate decarboxylase n=1 Tax=Vagococcus vulneris TaxID=1977869 RepID=A0A430A139_9ENTE|nr:diaminopimelate decarboxylase [Vagococcus vulneris]RSU00121.1 diaminopimelate decarboxylase [Vagococcus vulneris]
MSHVLFGTSQITEDGQLEIAGCLASDLAKEYGTPLFIYDVAKMKEMARGFKQTFDTFGTPHKVMYASKAFSCKAIYQLLKNEGLGFDVVSSGEIFTALAAGIEPSMLEFHGNNKTPAELEYAIDSAVGTIVIDNFNELDIVSRLVKVKNKIQTILLRVTPGVDAHTHDYILTGQEDSKFGFDVKSGQAAEALVKALADNQLIVAGIHCHIGSQIFDTSGFTAATEQMMSLLVDWRHQYDYVADVLNLGGGFGVRYTKEDTPLEPRMYVEKMIKEVKRLSKATDYPIPEIWIEPGRSIVAEAGTTLYTVGSRKEVANVRTFVAVDGGMGDNIRPALYQAKYTGLLADRAYDNPTETVTIVGKYCESGDRLIEDIELPHANTGDIFAMLTTGAYGYSMANHYNRNPKPAVVFVEDGQSQLVLRRETWADLILLDNDLK